jgi:hypothetical protein
MIVRLTIKDFMCPFSPCPGQRLSDSIMIMCGTKDTSAEEIAPPGALPHACHMIE